MERWPLFHNKRCWRVTLQNAWPESQRSVPLPSAASSGIVTSANSSSDVRLSRCICMRAIVRPCSMHGYEAATARFYYLVLPFALVDPCSPTAWIREVQRSATPKPLT